MNYLVMGLAAAGVMMASANAAVVFSGTDGSLDFDAVSGSHSVAGVEVTVSANLGVVNATSSGLGINHPAGGDATNAIDSTNAVEVMTLVFGTDVVFTSLGISGVGGNDALGVALGGGPSVELTSTGVHGLGWLVTAGQQITLTALEPNEPTVNNGVSITEFSVTAVPEPSSAALVSFGVVGLLAARRRRV